MLMKGKSFIPIFVLSFLMLHVLEAQKLKYTVSFTKNGINYTLPAKGEEKLMDQFDKVSIARIINKREEHAIKVYDNGDHETTISHLSTNEFPNYITKPAKTVIDKNGVRSYDVSGKIIVDIKHSEISANAYNSIKQSYLDKDYGNEEVKKFEDYQVTDIEKSGAKVKRSGTSLLHVRSGNREYLQDHEKQAIEEREFEGSNLKFSLHRKFLKDISGTVFVAQKNEINMVRNNSGRRFWNHNDEAISNHKVVYAAGFRSSDASDLLSSEDILTVYPNPTTLTIWIKVPANYFNNEATLNVKDVLGRNITSRQCTSKLESVDVTNYSMGVYFVELINSKGEKTSKIFTKQ